MAKSNLRTADQRQADGHYVGNVVLLSIPEREFATVAPHLHFVDLENPKCLERQGGTIGEVYFMNRGIGSLIVETPDGKSVEVGVAGREDMIGLQLAAGMQDFTHSVVVQVPGDGFRLNAGVLRKLLPSMPELTRMLLRRLAIRSVEFAQNAACNRLHNVKQRLARWLLLTHDRVDSDLIRTTHDFLSKLVGTDRATVTLAVSELERDGVIGRGRASISIKNRKKLERSSCACYSLFRAFNGELGLET